MGLGAEVTVRRNDEISAEETDIYTHLVLSPGPGLPKESVNLMAIINRHVQHKPILGICLGMQALAEHFGGLLYNQKAVKHGVTTEIETLEHSSLFKGLPKRFTVGLYHSWAVNESSLPTELAVSAKSTENVIMALEHKTLPVYGVQFHPESILTQYGREMLQNWLLLTTLK